MRGAATIVIVAVHGAEALEPALATVLREARAAAPPHAVLVVDPRGDEAVDALARAHDGVRALARAGSEGRSVAVNAGVASCATECVVLVGDAGLPPGSLARLLAPLDGGSRELFATSARTGRGPWRGTFRGGRVALTGDPLTPPLRAAAYDRALWAALGGLDPRFATRVWAEADLAWRARRRGWRLESVDTGDSGGEGDPPRPSRRRDPAARAAKGARSVDGRAAAAFERDRLLFSWKNLGRASAARHVASLPWQAVRAGARRGAFLTALAAAASEIGPVRRARRFERTLARLTDRAILATFEGA